MFNRIAITLKALILALLYMSLSACNTATVKPQGLHTMNIWIAPEYADKRLSEHPYITVSVTAPESSSEIANQ